MKKPKAMMDRSRKTAPGAKDAQRAEESMHADFARSLDIGLAAAYWAIQEGLDAAKRAGRSVVCGDPSAGLHALNQAAGAMSAASDSMRGLIQ